MKITRGQYTATVEHDDYPDSPRNWDNLSVMACRHRNYNLGDIENLPEVDTIEELVEAMAEEYGELAIWQPLYLLDHSGLRIKTGTFISDAQGWDTSLVGIVFVSKKRIREEYSVKRISKKTLDKARRVLEAEVKIYDQYLSGDVWKSQVKDGNGEVIDGNGDIFGYDEAVSLAENSLDSLMQWDKKAHHRKLKQYIRSGVGLQYRFN